MVNTLVAPNLPLGTALYLSDSNQGTILAYVLDTSAEARAAIVGAVPAWFVNQATPAPLDKQNGLTPATAFATVEQLSATLCPGGAVYTPLTNVQFNVAAGDYGRFYLRWAPNGFAGITMVGTHSNAPTFVLVSANPPTPSSEGTIGDLSGVVPTFQTRMRVLNGPAIGSILQQTAGVPAPGGNSFCTGYRESDGSLAWPVVGNTMQPETITTTLQRLDLETVLSSSNPGNGSFVLRDFAQVQVVRTRTQGATVTLSECSFPVTATFLCDGPSLDFVNCTNTQPLTLTGGVFTFAGCVNRSTTQVLNGFARVLQSCASSNGNWTVSSAPGLGSRGRADLVFVNDYNFENGGGALVCVTLGSGGNCWVNGRWLTNSSTPMGGLCTMQSGCWFYTASIGNLGPSTVIGDFIITGHAPVARASTPICYPRANCGVALINDPAAAAQTT